MSNLIVEIGNTAVKAALADGITLGRTFRYQGEKKIDYVVSLIEREMPELAVIASGSEIQFADLRKIKSTGIKFFILDPLHTDITEKYGFPSYMTYDRAAGMIAARHLFKGKPCTIFDFGTTLTVDVIDSEGKYEGGNISVGLRTRLKALNRYSKYLPKVGIPEKCDSLGHDVESSIESGAISGIMFEIQGYVASFPDNMIVFTGGDAFYFANRMKNSIFAICNLVLMGLALITDEYVSKNIQ